MDPEKRNTLLQRIARLKHDRVHAVTTYMPRSTFAWRADKVEFVPWPAGLASDAAAWLEEVRDSGMMKNPGRFALERKSVNR